MRVFLVNERAFPSAEGRMVYSPHVFKAIGMIAENPGCRTGALQSHLGLAPTTVSSLTKRLVSNGWVRRTPDPQDGRVVCLDLTTEGRAFYDAIYRQDIRNMDVILSTFDGDEREVFVDMLERVATRVVAAAEDQQKR